MLDIVLAIFVLQMLLAKYAVHNIAYIPDSEMHKRMSRVEGGGAVEQRHLWRSERARRVAATR